MQLMFFVLTRSECLESLMAELSHAGVRGATIVESRGMARALANTDDAILGSLRAILSPGREQNHTIMMALTEEMVDVAKQAIKSVVGDLSQPDTGILFTVPISSVEGMKI